MKMRKRPHARDVTSTRIEWRCRISFGFHTVCIHFSLMFSGS